MATEPYDPMAPIPLGFSRYVSPKEKAREERRMKYHEEEQAKLKALDTLAELSHCFRLSVNPHRDVYQSIATYLEQRSYADPQLALPDDLREEIIAKDRLVVVYFCPDTPVGSVDIYDHDPLRAIQRAIAWIREDRTKETSC